MHEIDQTQLSMTINGLLAFIGSGQLSAAQVNETTAVVEQLQTLVVA